MPVLEESGDVTILLFRLKIAKNRRKKIWALKQSLILGFIVQYRGISKPHYRTFLERELGTFDKGNR